MEGRQRAGWEGIGSSWAWPTPGEGPQTRRVRVLIKTLQEWPSDALPEETHCRPHVGAGDRALTIQDDPHRPEVYTGIVLPLTHHLGSHVERGATKHVLLIPGGHVLCKAKVCRQEARQQGSVSAPALQPPPWAPGQGSSHPLDSPGLTPLPYLAHVVSLTTNPSTSLRAYILPVPHSPPAHLFPGSPP